jgi:hypothetical protein
MFHKKSQWLKHWLSTTIFRLQTLRSYNDIKKQQALLVRRLNCYY